MEKLTASEALFGFAGWLTTRDEEVIASAKHDAGVWAKLVGEFCVVNELKRPRDGWENNLIHPSGECSNGREKQVITIEQFEQEVKDLFPCSLKIENDSWFHMKVNSVWKHKSIEILIFKNNAIFIEHGETLKEIYTAILKSLKKYFDEQYLKANPWK